MKNNVSCFSRSYHTVSYKVRKTVMIKNCINPRLTWQEACLWSVYKKKLMILQLYHALNANCESTPTAFDGHLGFQRRGHRVDAAVGANPQGVHDCRTDSINAPLLELLVAWRNLVWPCPWNNKRQRRAALEVPLSFTASRWVRAASPVICKVNPED